MVLPSAQMIASTRAHSGEVGNASKASTGFSSFLWVNASGRRVGATTALQRGSSSSLDRVSPPTSPVAPSNITRITTSTAAFCRPS